MLPVSLTHTMNKLALDEVIVAFPETLHQLAVGTTWRIDAVRMQLWAERSVLTLVNICNTYTRRENSAKKLYLALQYALNRVSTVPALG